MFLVQTCDSEEEEEEEEEEAGAVETRSKTSGTAAGEPGRRNISAAW